jgi:hypothetical protein
MNATHNRAATNKFTIPNRLIRRSGSWVCYVAILEISNAI